MPGLLRESPVPLDPTLATRQFQSTPPLAQLPDLVPSPPPDVAGDRLVMAGYHDCAMEAVRFLVEDEGRRHNDPTVVALAEHLQARSAYMEYLALLDKSPDGPDDELTHFLHSDPSNQQNSLSDQQRHLVETAFRGCDVIMHSDVTYSPTSQSAASSTPAKTHFRNNDYLDQILSWVYSEGED